MKTILVFISLIFCSQLGYSQFRLGNDKLIHENLDLIKNKRIGIVANHTSVLSNGEHIVDYLFQKNIKIVAVFGPEHGFRGDAPAGEKIETTIDEKTGITIYSLYGKINKPTSEMLKGIEIMIFDIQDVGARFYTYISTLYLVMEACAENNIPLIVCDRPNPLNGELVDGPVLQENLISFVGIAPMPVQHGLTIVELAKFYEDVILQKRKIKPDIIVFTMEGWKRSNYYDQINLSWIKPSPNIVNLETAIVYPGTCFLEATNVSEGRGTYEPFLTFGAPFINSQVLIDELKKYNFPIELNEIKFIPVDLEGMAKNPKYKNQVCNGVKIKVTNREKFEPVKFGLALLVTLKMLYPNDFKIYKQRMNLLIGDGKITDLIESGANFEQIASAYQAELDEFKNKRNKYLLYNN